MPTAGGPHAEFAAEIAHAVAVCNDAKVEVIYVTGTSEADEEKSERILASTAAVLEGVETSTLAIEGDDVVTEIVERSADHDITIIGASRESLMQQLVFGAIPEEVGRHAENTVIMAKRNLGITSRMTRWFRSHRRR